MNTSIFALKGHIIHTPTPKEFEIFENSYVICKKDTVIGIFKDLPEQYQAIPVFDYSGKLIIGGYSSACTAIWLSRVRNGSGFG